MRIPKDESEFEVSIRAADGEWEGRIVEYHISRLTPTLHLCHNWTSLEAALAGVQRRWQRLFPDDEAPDFRDAITVALSPE
jgi:hypothetical protein